MGPIRDNLTQPRLEEGMHPHTLTDEQSKLLTNGSRKVGGVDGRNKRFIRRQYVLCDTRP